MRNSLSQNVVIGPKKMVLKFHCLPALRSRLGFIKIITIDIKSVDIDSGNLKITNLDRLIFTKNGEFTI